MLLVPGMNWAKVSFQCLYFAPESMLVPHSQVQNEMHPATPMAVGCAVTVLLSFVPQSPRPHQKDDSTRRLHGVVPAHSGCQAPGSGHATQASAALGGSTLLRALGFSDWTPEGSFPVDVTRYRADMQQTNRSKASKQKLIS